MDTELTDKELTDRLAAAGIRIKALSHYYHEHPNRIGHTLVVNYADLNEEELEGWLSQRHSLN